MNEREVKEILKVYLSKPEEAAKSRLDWDTQLGHAAKAICQLDEQVCPECGGEGGIYPEGKPTYDDPARPSYPCDTCHGEGKILVGADDGIECPECNGRGYANYMSHYENTSGIASMTCQKCKGTGKVKKPDTEVCPACKGRGWTGRNLTACITCQGTGRKLTIPNLFHKVLGNIGKPNQEEILQALDSVSKKGLIAQMPDEWKQLLPKHLQSTPVVWMSGGGRTIHINPDFLDKSKLFRLNTTEVDWWVYAGSIPPEALDFEGKAKSTIKVRRLTHMETLNEIAKLLREHGVDTSQW